MKLNQRETMPPDVSKHLPRWRPFWLKGWFHFHQWRRSHVEGIEGPVSTTYHMGKGYREEYWECVKCRLFLAVKIAVSKEEEASQVQQIEEEMRRILGNGGKI